MLRNLQDLLPNMAVKLSQKLTNPIRFTGRVAQRRLLPSSTEGGKSSQRSRFGAGRQIDGVGGNCVMLTKIAFFETVSMSWAHYLGPFPPRCSFGPRVLLPSFRQLLPVDKLYRACRVQ